MTDNDKLFIPKEEIFDGIGDKTISALAKMTAKQIYNQGVEAGKIKGWNEAIEAAAIEAEKPNRPQFFIIEQIRKLKK